MMEPVPELAPRRSLLPWWLPLAPLLWSRLALGALPFAGSPHGVFPDLWSEPRLLEVEDLTLSLMRGGALGPLSLPPDLPDLDPECREMLLDFANSSAELTGCLVRSARPVRLCQTCYPLFQQVAGKMDNISRAVGVGAGDTRGLRCGGLGEEEEQLAMADCGGLCLSSWVNPGLGGVGWREGGFLPRRCCWAPSFRANTCTDLFADRL